MTGTRGAADKKTDRGGEATLDDLARRYLDLWQDQVSALAADDDLAEAMGRLLTSIGPGAMGPAASGALQPWLMWPAMMAGAWSGQFPGMPGMTMPDAGGSGRREAAHDGRRQGRGAGPGDAAGAAAGAEAVAAASGEHGGDLDELAGRLAVLERRIAALEGGDGAGSGRQGTSGPGRPPARRARKGRS